MRYKKLASALSTVRMFTRMCDFIQLSGFFIEKLDKILKGEYGIKDLSKHEILTWICAVFDFCSEFFDNWYYFVRIGAIKWSNAWQEKWVDWLSTFFSFSFIVLSIIEKFVSIYKAAKKKYREENKSLLQNSPNSSTEASSIGNSDQKVNIS